MFKFLMVKNKQNTDGRPYTAETMAEFSQVVKSARQGLEDTDKDGPAFCAPREGSSRRAGARVLARNWINLDIDGGKAKGKPSAGSQGISPEVYEKIKAVLSEYEGFIYPTYSDRPEGRKIRAVIALDTDLEPEQWGQVSEAFCRMELMERVPELKDNEFYSAAIDKCSWTPGQFMYTVPKNRAGELAILNGRPISTAQYLTVEKQQSNKGNYTDKKEPQNIPATPGEPEAGDYVLSRIIEKGLLRKDLGGGKYSIFCPLGTHDSDNPSSTIYYAPGAIGPSGKKYRYGSIICLHSTCTNPQTGKHYQTGDYFQALGLDYAAYCAGINDKERKKGESPDRFKTSSGLFTAEGNTIVLTIQTQKGEIPIVVFPDITVLGLAREEGGQGWGRLVSFKDGDNCTHEVLLLDKDLTGDGKLVREILSSEGFPVYFTGNKLGRYICDFIYFRPWGHDPDNPELKREAPKILIAKKGGWLEGAFIATTDKVFGKHKDRIYYEPEGETQANYDTKGTLGQWRDTTGYLAQYSAPLAFAISAAFAAPLIAKLKDIEQKSGGFHFYSSSTVGKTSIAEAAAGIYGDPHGGRVIQWSSTANAAEYIAAAHNDSLICLDELKTAKPYDVASMCYRLANSTMKSRAKKEGGLRRAVNWRLLWISTGETTIDNYIEQSGYRPEAGSEIRCIPIQADMNTPAGKTGAFRTLGIFDRIPERFTDIKEAFSLLTLANRSYYGVPGQEWLKWLCGHLEEAVKHAREIGERFNCALPEELGAQQAREAQRFRLVAIGGELATLAGLTGWQAGYATDTAVKMARRHWKGKTTETKEVQALIERFAEAAERVGDKFALIGTDTKAEWGLRNFSPDGAVQDFTAQGPDLAEMEEIPVKDDRKLLFFTDKFKSLIGNYSKPEACKILAEKGLLVMNHGSRYKARFKAGKKEICLYAIYYDKLLNLSNETQD